MALSIQPGQLHNYRDTTETVAEIPHVTEERAREVVENARSSAAGQTDPDTGPALSMVAEDLRIEIPAQTETCRLRSPNEKLLKGRSYSKEEGPHATEER